ncbi:hypothetical protein D3C81_1344990 [compost metagenome]
MQRGDFGDEVEAQPGALASAARARQGVEALGQARQGVVGNRLALVEQRQPPAAVLTFGAEADRPARRGEVQGVVEQIGQRLAQQEALAHDHGIGAQQVLDFHIGANACLQQFLDQLAQRHRNALLQSLPLLHLGQAEQPFDHLLQALALSGDIADEARPLLRRHLAFEQFGGTADRRQRAFQFVGQAVHVALDVLPALQLHAHAFHRFGQLRQLAATVAR